MTDLLQSAKVVVFNENNDVLVLRRSETHPTKPHKSDLPGGLVDTGESELLAMQRELVEETGIELDAAKFALYYSYTHMLPGERSFTMLIYQVHLDHTPEVTISWEHESYEWSSIDDLLKRDDLEQPERKSIEYALENDLFTV